MQFHLVDLCFSVTDVKFVDILLTSINFFRTKTDLRVTIKKAISLCNQSLFMQFWNEFVDNV